MKQYVYELMTDVRRSLLDQIFKVMLWVLSLVYDVIVGCTRGLYRLGVLSVYKAPKPVISVGNITVGGSGKTPLVIWITQMLVGKNIKTVVLNRGYGVEQGLNDEALMFKEIVPQVRLGIGKNRRQSIQEALNQEACDIFVADDAFQHWPLYRDLDIVTIDSVYPFGNGHLLPRGILREHLTALSRADIFVLTKTERVEDIRPLRERLGQLNPKALIVESCHVIKHARDIRTGKIHEPNVFKGQKVMSFCAIADPSAFVHTLEKVGFVLAKLMNFTDHHSYDQNDAHKIAQGARDGNMNILVTTHKDAVKIIPLLYEFKDLTVLSLDIELEITQGQEEFIERIMAVSHR